MNEQKTVTECLFDILGRALRRPLRWLLAAFRSNEYVLYPEILNPDDLSDVLRKVSYMLPNQVIRYAGAEMTLARNPEYLTEISLSRRIERVSKREILLDIARLRNVLVWKIPSQPAWHLLKALPQVFNVDRHAERFEGWRYFEAYNYPLTRSDRVKPRFSFDRYPRREKCYVFGTGPSLDSAFEHRFDDGYRVICNTMIKNRKLMRHIDPNFLVFADAIFHFGPSIYAGVFRQALYEFSEAHPQCEILVPEDFFQHFVHCNPDFRGRMTSIPSCRRSGVNLDFRRRFCYSLSGNILTIVLIPLASTLADKVFFLGFDGRGKGDKGFWAHSKDNNFEDLLPAQQLAHPAFFNRDYDAYASRQGDESEQIMSHGEAHGISYVCLNPSNNPALKKRHVSAYGKGASR